MKDLFMLQTCIDHSVPDASEQSRQVSFFYGA